MTLDFERLKLLATTVRMLSVDMVERAGSGHPGMPLGAADYTSLLWAFHLNFDPALPSWLNRDRFVLSAGHGSALLYSLLHLFEYDLPLLELERFRQWGSRTPGHPEFGHTPGVEITSGPLGQGFANGVGLALSSRLLSETYGTDLLHHRVFTVVSDGDLMEGISAEAASLAGHLGLGNLICIYDNNQISIGGQTRVCFSESVAERFAACGWHVQNADGHDFAGMQRSIEAACAEKAKPSLILAATKIGFGSPNRSGTADVHGSPLGKEETVLTRRALGWPSEGDFIVPQEVRVFCAERVAEKRRQHEDWDREFQVWRKASPESAAKLDAQLSRSIPEALKKELVAAFSQAKKDATRSLSGQALQVIFRHVPFLIGGSADLEPSTKTLLKGSPDISRFEFSGRNIRFGVREHAMGAVINGLAYSRAWVPFGATFLVFSDYMRPAVRLAALSRLQSIFIFTHDSFWVGEDGPTHQPVEHASSLRLIPGLHVFRPADGLETAVCYWQALNIKDGPSALLLTRQNTNPIERPAGFNPDDILRGAYIVSGGDQSDLVFVASGSEVGLAALASRLLAATGVQSRVVSMPCQEIFKCQPEKYQKLLIPPGARKVCVEAGSPSAWDFLENKGPCLRIGLDHFGASAPAEILAEKFGFTPQAVFEKVRQWLKDV